MSPGFWPRTSSFASSSAHVSYACAELTRQALLWSPSLALEGVKGVAFASDRRKVQSLGLLISNALAMRLEFDSAEVRLDGTVDIESVLFPHLGSQAQHMRSFAFRGAQAIWMFQHAVDARLRRSLGKAANEVKRLQRALEEELQMSVPEFVGCIWLLYARSNSETPAIDVGRLYLTPEILDEVAPWLAATRQDATLRTPLLAKVIAQLARTQAEFVAAMRQSRQPETDGDDDLLVGPSPLSTHPIVLPFSNTRALGVAPVPRLLLDYLYEPLIDRLYQVAVGLNLTRAFNELLEDYVGLVLNRYSPVTIRWLSESEVMPPQGNVVDWVAEFRSHLLLFEVKRAWLSPAAYHRLNQSDWASFEATLERAVRQGSGFLRQVRAGAVPALRAGRDKKPVLVVVLGSDIRITPGTRRVRAQMSELAHRLAPGLGVVFLGLDQLHALLNGWQKRDVDWLAVSLDRCSKADGAGIDAFLDQTASGPMWRAFTETIVGGEL